MLSRPEQWFVSIGKLLRTGTEEITGEPLPKRWLDLILHLDEQEQSSGSRVSDQARKP